LTTSAAFLREKRPVTNANRHSLVKTMNGLAGRFLIMFYMALLKITQFVCQAEKCLTKSFKEDDKALKNYLKSIRAKNNQDTLF